MKTRIVGIMLAVALLVAPAWGIIVDCQDYMTQVGVRLVTSGKSINIEKGQTVKATVANPTTLAARGLKGTKPGDGIQVTMGEKFMEEFKFTVQHVPTGRSIEITYRPK